MLVLGGRQLLHFQTKRPQSLALRFLWNLFEMAQLDCSLKFRTNRYVVVGDANFAGSSAQLVLVRLTFGG